MNDPQAIYNEAQAYATEQTKDTVDTKYGCGSSWITIKGNTKFAYWARKNNLVERDAYYGTILRVASPFNGTLEDEAFQNAFASKLSSLGVHAFAHTRLN